MQVTGWLRGYFTGRNQFDERTDGDVTKDTREKEWMPWIFSYCRSHPTEILLQAAIELTKAIAQRP
jgi:hypothetical protein